MTHHTESSPAENTLCGMIANQNLPHALLFTGPAGTGRKDIAMALALSLNCQNATHTEGHAPSSLSNLFCGKCKSCRKITAQTHPDIRAIQPDGTHIKIAQIRELCDTLLSKPLEARYRLIVIQEADRMNTQAANALLKVLEEPPLGTHFVLLALQPSELLPTIVSRCQVLRFRPLPREVVACALMEEFSLSKPEAITLSALCGENLGKAKEIANSKAGASRWLLARKWLAENLPMAGRGDVAHALSFAEIIGRDRETALSNLALIRHYLHDLMMVNLMPSAVANVDLIDQIKNDAARLDANRITAMVDVVHLAKMRIEGNSVMRHTLEVMALELMGS